ncbi:MAG: hypothetical protein JW892_12925 [Anaerolineae bacterium]|nr:hypothetical protein [Anaerolineae bacterium]
MAVQAYKDGAARERDRLSIVLAVTLTGVTLLRFVELPTFSWSMREILGSPLGLSLTGDWVQVLLMMGLVASGTFSLLQVHPEIDTRERSLVLYLITPTLGALLCALILIQANSWPLWLGSLLGSGILIGVLMHLAYRSLSPRSSGFAGARTLLNIAAYLLSFTLFGLSLNARERALVTGPVILILSGLWALELLSAGAMKWRSVAMFSGVIAVQSAELAWVLAFWPISPWMGAILLTLGLYLSVGVCYQYLLGKLTRHVVLEFSILTLSVFLLVLLIKP